MAHDVTMANSCISTSEENQMTKFPSHAECIEHTRCTSHVVYVSISIILRLKWLEKNVTLGSGAIGENTENYCNSQCSLEVTTMCYISHPSNGLKGNSDISHPITGMNLRLRKTMCNSGIICALTRVTLQWQRIVQFQYGVRLVALISAYGLLLK